MKKAFILLLLTACALTGCDFVRTLSGRPTSAQVEKMRQERMAREEAAHQARLDSLERVQKQMEDSLAAQAAHLLDSLVQSRGTVLNPSKLGGLYTTRLESQYYIVVGAFRNRAYAERKLNNCNEAGYTATIISFRNGLLAVAICPSNNLKESFDTLKSLRGTAICPKDGWILVNE